jgi:hypothetical protein
MAAVTFDVEHVVKGAFGPKAIVRTNAQGSSCGLELLGAARTGLLLRRAADGLWESDLCSMVTPSELLAVGSDHPTQRSLRSAPGGNRSRSSRSSDRRSSSDRGPLVAHATTCPSDRIGLT